jgi:hypothetical protein
MLAAGSSASSLKDVRVGPHGEYTRVVLETDAKTSYSLNQSDTAVTVELQASAAPKAVAAKSQQLSWVRVEPQGASTLVKIELKGPARVKQMVLTGPNRIVLDVYADAAAASRPEPSPVAADPKRVAPAPPPIAAGATPKLEDEAALVDQEAEALLGPAASPIPGDDLAATEGVPVDESFDGATGESATEIAPAAEPAKPKFTAPVTRVERDKGLLDWLQDPYILGGLAIVMLGLVVILRRRRPVAKPAPAAVAADEDSSAASLFAPPDETPAASDRAPVDEDATVSFGFDAGAAPSPEPSSEPEAPAETGSAFEFEAPDVEPEKPDLGRAHGATISTIGALTSTAAYETPTPTATGGLSMPELDRRLALLEQRLEEVIDAKDRLERQVSAQTEELRVQRAAIARTQRVLRTVVRPEDDQPSEPVLKS